MTPEEQSRLKQLVDGQNFNKSNLSHEQQSGF
jgi:hypothetical protein